MSEGAPIAILDYGMGNLRSVEKAVEHVGGKPLVGCDPAAIRGADGLILPGVGAFPEAMQRIRARRLDALIGERVAAGAPLLGLCLGMQLLFESSTELGGAAGLGLLAGEVDALDGGGAKLPHIGWSPLHLEEDSPLSDGIADAEPFYFVHSYVARPRPEDVLASCEYGERFAAVVGRGRVFGTQFHPEKSSRAGLRMLRNFVRVATPASTGA